MAIRPSEWSSGWNFRGLFLLFLLAMVVNAKGQTASRQPSNLRCDALVEPLGIDSRTPVFSWRLNDERRGARQTAYEIGVYSRASTSAQPDVWDSGKIVSGVSTGVAYAGPALEPAKRYFWRVQVWDQAGEPYPASDLTWWETGLLDQTNWKAQWIGYEEPELHSLRESGATWITNAGEEEAAPADTRHDYRLHLALDKPVKRAVLYTTGEDTAGAWVNGAPVLAAQPLNAWQQMPWGTYVRKDVTPQVHAGANVIAVEVTRYRLSKLKTEPGRTPMSMCLYVVFADGSTRVFSSASPGWKAGLNVGGSWWETAYSDGSWREAERYVSKSDPFGSRDDRGIPWPTGPVAMLRKTFRPAKAVVSARLYATALGMYSFRLNGAPVGDQVLAPGWMDYREHVAYQVYDVTAQLRPGSNALAAYLAPGWYSTPLRWYKQGNNYGNTQPALLAQLRLEHADGTVEWVATDASWKADTSPILQAEIYDGETRDARREQPGWDTAAFSRASWKPVMVVTPHVPDILAQTFQPVRKHDVLTAKAITSPKPGVYIFDFGQNMTALPRLQVKGKRGEDVQLRFAEVLNPDGTLYIENLRTAKATDHFVLAGLPSGESYEPQFTFHGFRYAEVSGLTVAPTVETLKATVLYTDAPATARFSTGDPMVNQIWSNVIWGQRSNFIGTPTDCPQRDERLGWSADAQVFWRTATYNMDLTTFSEKYAADLRGTQAGTSMYGIFAPGVDAPSPGYGAAWSDAGVIIPWTGWIQSGNRRIIEQNWSAMQAYLAEIEQKNPDHLWRNGFGSAFGDWLTPTITTPEDLLATAYWAYDVALMQQMAEATGRNREARAYSALHDSIRTAFQKAFVRADGFVGSIDRYPSIPPPTIHPEPGDLDKDHVVETQTGYVLALYMDLIPAELRAKSAERLVKKIEQNHWNLGTGFLGTPYLLEVLSDTGYSDVAYRLLLNREYPSWGYLIDHGATTTWERWNGDQMRNDPSMNSYNHYAYGAVAEWMYRYGAGIDTQPGGAGFRSIYLHPNFDARLGRMSLDYDSTYGTIHSDWVIQGDRVTWKVTVPPNTTATLPIAKTNAADFRIDGEPLARSARLRASGAQQFELQPGAYTFTATLKGAGKPDIAKAE